MEELSNGAMECLTYSPVALRQLAEVEAGRLYNIEMFFVYVIYNKKHQKIYIGQTSDLSERLRLHNSHELKKSFTSRFDGEWELIYKEEFSERLSALKREQQLKSYQGRLSLRKHIPR